MDMNRIYCLDLLTYIQILQSFIVKKPLTNIACSHEWSRFTYIQILQSFIVKKND